MPNSQPSKKSSSRSEAPPQLDLLLEQTTPVDLHQEWPRRQQEAERQKIERNAKLRREQSGRRSLLNFVRYFWHALEPPSRDLTGAGIGGLFLAQAGCCPCL
jgi:hypothetical protein